MKILNVCFRNINSLRGDWEIPFDCMPLSDAGIFAIIGPTGAGKTSILDAISLALYGETPRLKKPAEQIMTKHTGDCFSEVTFSIKNRTYRSRWAVRRAKKKPDGKLQPVKMVLADIGTGHFIEEKLSMVPVRVAELTGLDFKRFSRSIMLAQGDFAAFLNAKENERAELLEKITGTEIYSKISAKAFEKAKAENGKMLRLKDQIVISFMEPSRIKEIEEEVRDMGGKIRETEKSLDILRCQQEWQKGLKRLEEECEESRRSFENAQKQREAMEADIRRLEISKRAMAHKPDIEILDARKKQAAEIQEALAALQKEIPELESRLSLLEEKRKGTLRDLEHAKNIRSEAEQVIGKVLLLDRDMANEEQHLRSLNSQMATLKKEQKRILDQQLENETAIRGNLTHQEEIAEWLDAHRHDKDLPGDMPVIRDRLEQLAHIRKKHSEFRTDREAILKEKGKAESERNKTQSAVQAMENGLRTLAARQEETEKKMAELSGGSSMEDMDQAYSHRRDFLGIFKELRRIATEHDASVLEKERLEKQIREDEKGLLRDQKRLVERVEERAREENIRSALEKAAEQEMLIAKYEDHRNRLRAGEPCPLCGSRKHPFAVEGPPREMNSRKALNDQNARLQGIQKKLEALSHQITRVQTRAGENKKQLSDIKERIMKFRKDRERLRTDAKRMWEAGRLAELTAGLWETGKPEELAEIIRAMETGNRKLNSDIKSLRNCRGEMEQIRRACQKEKEKLARRQTEIIRLENALESGQKELARVEKEIRDIGETERDQSENLQKGLATYQEPLPPPGMEDALNKRLAERYQTYGEYVKRQKDLEKHLQDLRGKAASFSASLQGMTKQIADLEQHLRTAREKLTALGDQRKAIFGEKDPLEERQRLEKEVEKTGNALEGVTKEYNETDKHLSARKGLMNSRTSENERLSALVLASEAELLSKITSSGFDGIEDLRNSLLPMEQQQRIETAAKEADKHILQARTRLETVRKKLEAEKAKEMTGKTLEEITEKIDEGNRQKEELTKRLGANQKVLEDQEVMRKTHTRKMREIENQEKECHRWDRLNRLIGSKKGDVFRKFAQGLTLDRLLWLSNQHLEKLNDRYHVCRQENQGLGLEVVDTYQADIRRPANTLSGGESFLVSLAMALGLSDLAGKRTKVDSLFLDEGFGFLDDESLSIALSTLETLQSGGKMIGVVSHVEALKERITTQIQVKRMTGGISRLEITA
ncbi:AAA family ATPase [Desulfobacterales bacterium HSG2]|nr:AAA family ATPase [Desulfobacterales bacterium HSG2]